MFVVCWTTKIAGTSETKDHWNFFEHYEGAQELYKILLELPNTYAAVIGEIVKSTEWYETKKE